VSQSLKATRAGLLAACRTIYAASVDSSGAPVAVTDGPPGSLQPQIIVAVGMATRQPITRPTMGTGRSRDTEAQIDVIVSVFVPGAEVAQTTANDACDDLTDLLQAYFRVSGNESLGGGCRDAWVSNIEGPRPDVIPNESGGVAGRVAESVVTVTARIRY